MSAVEAEIAALEALSSAVLRERWSALTGSPVPRISPKLLRLALAWELQARSFGGLSRATTRTLDQLGRGETLTAPARPGMRLVREWQGRVHVVTVGEDQVVRWEERPYRSLSEVARAITGTRWSGPAFFGLKKKVAA
ncbi:DUF2924 domain-containing protein [Microvirga sp. SRT01]|jgi:hypothetical protein|uniref:DUF2924 domain-containing protein n=1 Tax=Sphingomonas longa TaxID=2778730 RepID=A0ABS2DCP1_9SPHN|nr:MULTISPECIES: DUF2924 domain-containing protein [Alphaproteobacteria]MBM6577846.1 DUF2924 domain-containing protein [Sphingomonas sp. BT552]MBR7710887.1 DUF2924 domain-containing protein [Microvirga sp. SRT01]